MKTQNKNADLLTTMAMEKALGQQQQRYPRFPQHRHKNKGGNGNL